MRFEGNLVGEEVSVGETVTVNRALPQQYRLNTNDLFDLNVGDLFTVTRVGMDALTIRTVDERRVRGRNGMVYRQVSFSVSRLFLMYPDPNYVPPPPPPPPRKLGVAPEGEDIIHIDHPGIQWLFEDMGRFAEEKGYCSQYDALCLKLGIPGRPRDFDVRKTIGGVEVRATIKARSQREANEKFAEAISAPSTPAPEPDFAPAA